MKRINIVGSSFFNKVYESIIWRMGKNYS